MPMLWEFNSSSLTVAHLAVNVRILIVVGPYVSIPGRGGGLCRNPGVAEANIAETKCSCMPTALVDCQGFSQTLSPKSGYEDEVRTCSVGVQGL